MSEVALYESYGRDGLKTKKCRGRKSILKDTDLAAVREAVQENRQRLRRAKAELGKEFSVLTFPPVLARERQKIQSSSKY